MRMIFLTVSVFFPSTQARKFLSTLGDLSQTQIFAKIENVEVNFQDAYFTLLAQFISFMLLPI
jgi:hypothetical protein